MSKDLKGTMKIEFIGHDFKENPKRTKIPFGKLKLPEEVTDELLYVGEDDDYLHCFVVNSGTYYGIYKSDDKSHLYQFVLKLNTSHSKRVA